MSKNNVPNWQTLAVHGGTRRSIYGEMSEALFLTQGFMYESAEQAEQRFVKCPDDEFIYARYGNPTVRMLEERMAGLEGVEDGFATASGMAAVSGTLCSILSAGDHLVSSRALFGSCLYIVQNVLPRFGVEVEMVDGTDLEQWQRAIRPETKLVFLETVSNPMLEVIDLQAVGQMARQVDAMVVADNALATPVFQRSAERGADVIIYSTTKHVDGQGRCLGGIVLGSRAFIRETLEPFVKHTGGALSPFNAWVMLKGLETMSLRCRHQAAVASEIGRMTENHPNVVRTYFPMLESHPQFDLACRQMTAGGTVVTLQLKGGKKEAFQFINALKLVKISNNFGDAKSIITHPATTTHQRLAAAERKKMGILDSVVRVSVGLEDQDDLIADLKQALDVIDS